MNQVMTHTEAQAAIAEIVILAGTDRLRSVLKDMVSRGTGYGCVSAVQLGDLSELEGLKLIISDGQSDRLKEIAGQLKALKKRPRVVYLTTEADRHYSDWVHVPIPISRRNLLTVIELAMSSEGGEGEVAALPRDYELGRSRFIPSKRLIIEGEGGAEIRLTEKESAILELLLSHGQPILSRDSLYNQIWGRAANVTEHTVDSHLYRLRRKILVLGCELIAADSGYFLRMV